MPAEKLLLLPSVLLLCQTEATASNLTIIQATGKYSFKVNNKDIGTTFMGGALCF